MMYYLLFIFLCLPYSLLSETQDAKTVLLSITARNKEHLLPKYLQTIKGLDYDKKKITLFIQTYNNTDETKKILQQWIKENEETYQKIHFESQEHPAIPMQKLYHPVQSTAEELQFISALNTQAFRQAKESGCDFCFIVECGSLIAPCTLKALIEKDKPIIAPLLKAIPCLNDVSSTYFCAVNEEGYYEDHPDYLKILFHWKVGTFKVPLVYRTMLIKSEYLDQLYYDNETLEYDHIVFGRCLREKGIESFICNDRQFGVMVNFSQNQSLDDERLKLQTLLMIP